MTTTTTTAVHVGDTAPDFTIASTDGAMVTLSSFRGHKNVLIAFFPLAFTGTCTAELCAFSEDFDQFSTSDVQIIPISVDAVPSLKEFRAKYDMKVDLASDFRREVSRAYGVLREESYFSKRAYFLIDKSGVVRWMHVEEKSGVRRENTEILEAIAALSA